MHYSITPVIDVKTIVIRGVQEDKRFLEALKYCRRWQTTRSNADCVKSVVMSYAEIKARNIELSAEVKRVRAELEELRSAIIAAKEAEVRLVNILNK